MDERPENDDWLDPLLARRLTPPPLPPALVARVLAQARQDDLQAIRQHHAAREAALRAELADARARLRRSGWRQGAQGVGVAVAVSFAAGALTAWTLPWWPEAVGGLAAQALPVLALALGMGSGWLASRRA
jgi:hypothetical protein